jgi:hypothetical protein
MSHKALDPAEEVDANKRRLVVLGESTTFVFGFIALRQWAGSWQSIGFAGEGFSKERCALVSWRV